MWRWIAQFACWIWILAGLFHTRMGEWSPDILGICFGFLMSSIIGVPAERPAGVPPPLPGTDSWLKRTFSLRRWPWFVIPAGFIIFILVLKLGLAGHAEAVRQTSSHANRAPFPADQFVEYDSALAKRLGHQLPAGTGLRIPSAAVWEARQRMFLALPENSRITRSETSFASWEKAMNDAYQDAMRRNLLLDDYQLMEAGRDRMR